MSNRELNLKQILLTAVITCVVSIVAGVVIYLITTKNPKLSYSVTTGPTLSIQGEHKRILSVEVVNSGRRDIDDVAATIQIENGKIEEVTYETSPGLTLTEDRQESSYNLKAASLNPDEKLSISLLATLTDPEIIPVIAARGNGITGSLREDEKNKYFGTKYYVAGVVIGFVGLIATSALRLSPLLRKVLFEETI